VVRGFSVKLSPLIFILLILFSTQIASASGSTNVSTGDPAAALNLTTPIKVDTENETATVTLSKGVSITASTNESSKLSAGAQMVKNGIESVVVDNVNDLFVGVGGLQLGELNDSDEDNSQIAIFAIAAHTIDPTKDSAMMERIETMREIYIYAILLFAGILALFLICQSIDPDKSAELLEQVTGNYNYVAASDMARYFINTCGWLLLGPGLFFGALKINNVLVEGQMLSILDQVAFSSDSIGLYIIFGLLWLISIFFFAIRLVLIIISAHVWIMYGLGFAFKKIRWAAILVTTYQICFIFAQFAIVWVCCVVVSYTTSQTLAWYSVSFVYLGLFGVVVGLEFLFVVWPVLWKVLSPKTLTTAIKLARYI